MKSILLSLRLREDTKANLVKIQKELNIGTLTELIRLVLMSLTSERVIELIHANLQQSKGGKLQT